ncbi:MAG: hypothetical protein KKH94_12865 [Candidatus Omnitrophica bacterium]|nr:hypothetical protein [Candidatus Omnitrophota bacterium]
MKDRRKRSLLRFSFPRFTLFAPKRCGKDGYEKNPNVIIVTLAGVRAAESIIDRYFQYMSNIFGVMCKEGVLYTHVKDPNYHFHDPTYRSIISGKQAYFYSPTVGLTVPSLFQYVRKQYALPATKTWAIGYWTKAASYCKTKMYRANTFPCYYSPGNGISQAGKMLLTREERGEDESYVNAKNICTWAFWDSQSVLQYKIVKRIMYRYKPKLVHFALNSTDCAHYGTFGRYSVALKEADKEIFDIWNMIQEDPYYKNRTYFLVGPDHIRNLYYMHHTQYRENDHSWIYIFGPRVKENETINRPVYQIDLFATVAHIMDVKTHKSDGEVLWDCFKF